MATDTTAEARAVQLAALRSMSTEDRLRSVLQLSEDVRTVTLEGIRRRHPEAPPTELVALLVEQWHGPELAAVVLEANAHAARP